MAAFGVASRQAAPIDDRHRHRDGCFTARALNGPRAARGRGPRPGGLDTARVTPEGLRPGRGGVAHDDLAAPRARLLA